VHRSTLKYRLRRIREITDYDLADPDTRFNLQFAPRTKATLDALRSGGTSATRTVTVSSRGWRG
jgi:hypothetical protein